MKTLSLVLVLFLATPALAFEDPTGGKPFFPWIWEDQFRPTITESFDQGGIGILLGGAASTIVAHQYDPDVFDHNKRGEHLLIGPDASGVLATVGGGGLGVGIIALQLFVDQKNGLKHGRAVVMTTLTHVITAAIAQRKRPGDRADYLPFPSSFPSGHTSSAFATAASLGYSYGWWAGVPAIAVASAIAAGRVSENAHWLSDVTAGAALGLYWAHASNNVDEKASATAWQFNPLPLEDGLQLQLSKNF